MSALLQRLVELPAHGLAALAVLLLYVVESEIRFGARARSIAAGASDRGSTLALSIAPVIAMRSSAADPTGSCVIPATWDRSCA
jgi:hypothetical protein